MARSKKSSKPSSYWASQWQFHTVGYYKYQRSASYWTTMLVLFVVGFGAVIMINVNYFDHHMRASFMYNFVPLICFVIVLQAVDYLFYRQSKH